MECWAWRRDIRKRRSMARLLRASSSMSVRIFHSLQKTQIPSRRVGDHLIELPAHGCQAELVQLLVKGAHEIPFWIAE